MFKNKKNNYQIYELEKDKEGLYLTKYCEWKDCLRKGEFRAPSSREKLREFRWFCLDHVKIYNKSWDYFKGKTSDEIYTEVSRDAWWHRPTWKRTKKFKIIDNVQFFKNATPNVNSESCMLEKGTNEVLIKACNILDIKPPYDLQSLKKQYKKMVKKFHPDINDNHGNEYIIKLNDSYSLLLKYIKNKGNKNAPTN